MNAAQMLREASDLISGFGEEITGMADITEMEIA